ncbi:MAG: glycerophosphodiester phosphodiesterase family protein [Longimicrobiales bacterium]|nr:glycerophosphodiester phosphodiesterase family protein [Longimicrobiales bacterium]
MEIIAHRGFSARAPENTLAAIRAALDAGADAVEWDMHAAACGTPVLIHDPTLERTTDGTGTVVEHTAEALRALDAGGWFHPDFAGEPVPTFAEALALTEPAGVTVYAEVKGCRDPGDLDRMARTVRQAGMASRTVFISLDFGLVDHLARVAPEARVGYVVDRRERMDDALARARPLGQRGVVDPDRRFVLREPDLVGRIRSQGNDVAVWTVDDPDEAEALVRAGVRRLTTNRVTDLLRWREARNPEARPRGARPGEG